MVGNRGGGARHPPRSPRSGADGGARVPARPEPDLREEFEGWAFSYNTGSPIVYSAMLLREALRDAVKKLDPTGVDPGLNRMVVIGHSQGGLLTKVMDIHSADRLFAGASRRPLDELGL